MLFCYIFKIIFKSFMELYKILTLQYTPCILSTIIPNCVCIFLYIFYYVPTYLVIDYVLLQVARSSNNISLEQYRFNRNVYNTRFVIIYLYIYTVLCRLTICIETCDSFTISRINHARPLYRYCKHSS